MVAACWAGAAGAQSGLDAGGLTFKDFAIADNGASFNRNESIPGSGAGPARLIGVRQRQWQGACRFDSIRSRFPYRWLARGSDSERGVAFQRRPKLPATGVADRLRLEGVKDPEHYGADQGRAIEARRPA